MKQPLSPKNAAAPIGPYSPAIRSGNMLWLSGQIPLNPETQELVSDDVTEQAHQVLKNVKELLAAANATYDHIVSVTLYLTNMDDFAKVNAVYEQYMTTPYPARTTIMVAGLPKGSKVEMVAIANLDQ